MAARKSRTRTKPGRPAPPLAQRADDHRRTRAAHATEIAEDYVETIADLIDLHGEARVVDIARCLGVSHVTVIRTIARLQREDLVTARPYRAIFLTETGRELALRARRRHQVVVQFLESIGVKPEVARTDAEGLEHHISHETLAALERFVARQG
jgi:DtxR family manganese transport transcriptional regulator